MHINVWFSVKDGVNEDIITAVDWDSEQGEYDGSITPEQIDVFSRMADRQAVQPLFLKNQNKSLWSTSFTFPDLPTDPPVVIVEPDLPALPPEIDPCPEEPVDREEIVHPPYTPVGENETPEELAARLAADQIIHDDWHDAVDAQAVAIAAWEASPEYDEWVQACKDWKDNYKDWQKAVEDAMKPWHKEVADLKAVIKKQSDAFAKTDTAVQQLLSDLPNDLELLGAWFMDDGAQAMPLSNDLIKFMPDVPDGFENDGITPKYKKATEIVDVNLIFGQAPRDFS